MEIKIQVYPGCLEYSELVRNVISNVEQQVPGKIITQYRNTLPQVLLSNVAILTHTYDKKGLYTLVGRLGDGSSFRITDVIAFCTGEETTVATFITEMPIVTKGFRRASQIHRDMPSKPYASLKEATVTNYSHVPSSSVFNTILQEFPIPIGVVDRAPTREEINTSVLKVLANEFKNDPLFRQCSTT